MPSSRLTLCLVAVALAGATCTCKSKPTPKGPEGSIGVEEGPMLALDDAPDGLALRLSEGSEDPSRQPQLPVAKAQKLSHAVASKLLARMPGLKSQADDRKDFALRDRSKPPPRTGETVPQPFPPPLDPSAPSVPSAKKGELQVLRFAPEGEVPVAPHLSVTFDQPMVAVTSHTDSVKGALPVKLEPQPPGQWRWIGTRTLLFDPDVRFPMATQYEVTVAEGTKSINGDVLGKAVSFEFATPPPTVRSAYPTGGPHELDPLLFVSFDQVIDPARVLESVHLEAGSKRVGVRAATAEEIAADETVAALVAAENEADHENRYLVFRAKESLPPDTKVSIVVEAGTPSSEGPRKTAKAQRYDFQTYGPFEVVEARCSWGNDCPPGTPWSIRFTNPIDTDAFEEASIRISPELPRRRLRPSGQWLTIEGTSKSRTTYTVKLPKGLKDAFGQRLGSSDALTFAVGDAHPQLFGRAGLALVEPAAKNKTFDVHSVNIKSLDVEVYRVEPKDWDAFALFMRKNPRRPGKAPGKKVVDETIAIDGPLGEMVETAIDLTPALGEDGLGHAVVLVEPTSWDNQYKPQIHSWVQSTNLALDAFVDASELLAWATDLGTGKPLADVALSIEPGAASAKTDKEGLATLELPSKASGRQMLVGRRGADVAFLPQNTYFWSDHGGWQKGSAGQDLRWMVFDDRGMYRPKETVHVKGWLRVIDAGEGGDVNGLRGAASSLSYKVVGPRGNELRKGTAKISALGGFDLSFELPDTPNLGYARIELTARAKGSLTQTTYNHGFQIQEFRRPEFEVSTSASQGPHMVGGGADVTVSASYYAGGPLPNAEVGWTVTSSPTTFTPPNRDDFTFGSWTPWWGWHGRSPNQPISHATHAGKTDGAGKHILHLDFLSIKPPRPMSVVAEGRVTDVNRQAWASSSTLLVHPSELYVGLKRDRYFFEQGKPIELDTIVVDQDGKAIAGRKVDVKSVRLDWSWKNGQVEEEETDEQHCTIESTTAAVPCELDTPEGGTYRITATVYDDRERPNQTEILVWVTGGKQPPSRDVTREEVTIIPDKKEYAPGDTASLLVQAPFSPASGLLTVRRSGITRTERFTMKGSSTTLKVPIEDRHVPNLHVQIDLVGAAARIDDDGKEQPSLPKRPAYAAGTIELSVPPKTRTLALSVEPEEKKIAPGGKTHLGLSVRDAAGKPVKGAELAVIVVDESVLALSNYQSPDPLAVFYSARPAGATDYYMRQYVALTRADNAKDGDERAQSGDVGGVVGGVAADMAVAESAPAPPAEPGRGRMMAKSASTRGPGAAAAPIALRTNFDALAVFAPEVRTDAQGQARVEVEVPDNLTRYRVMVVAVAGDRQFGSGESSITARMPLMVRPSAPRFLNFGDRFELPVVVQNQTDDAMQVDVAMRTTNLALTDAPAFRVQVPANDRVELRFPAAAEMPGTARFQVAAASGSFSDGSESALPVWTPATTEAFATYGEIDDGAVRQPVAMPEGVVEEFGGLEITTSSTQLQSLTDAVLYLVSYPFECTEQTSSRILAVAALRDVLSAFEAEGLPPPKEIEATVKRDIAKLAALQNWDGGFAFWVRGHESWPYVSIHAAHSLARARAKGFDVPQTLLDRSKEYLRNIERHIPAYYGPELRRVLIAYALYVRRHMGDADPARARKLFAEAGTKGLSMEALGWILGAVHGDKASSSTRTEILRYLDNKVSETAATAHWTTSYSDGAHLILSSSRRADGVLLEALIEERPKSDLIAKVVRGLLAHRVRGHWQNTQENAFVLLGMDAYFQAYEKVTPSFVARLWLGDGFVGEQRFRGRSTDRLHVEVPMAYLAKQKGAQDLILSKRGKGRLYYRVGMTYAPEDLSLPPADHGFAVERRYEAIDDPDDVVRQKDGSWKIKAGAPVRVRLTMAAEARRYHVALVDPLPAGLEPMNPALAVTGNVPADPKAPQQPFWWWLRPWYEHQNLRDERVEAFTSLLWAGVHEYSYVARATTPGRFVVPPTKAEEMYFPETFGRSAGDVVVVE